MKTKVAVFRGSVGKIAQGLPTNIAASIGRIIARHSFLENQQAQILRMLLGISIKQVRIAVRLPAPKMYSSTIKSLLQFHDIPLTPLGFNFNNYTNLLDEAGNVRNGLAHSLFARHPVTKQFHIQLVRGSWDLGQETESVSRALHPDSAPVTREYLKKQRSAIEDAIKETIKLYRVVAALMNALNEIRRTQPEQDRRSRRGLRLPLSPPQSSPA